VKTPPTGTVVVTISPFPPALVLYAPSPPPPIPEAPVVSITIELTPEGITAYCVRSVEEYGMVTLELVVASAGLALANPEALAAMLDTALAASAKKTAIAILASPMRSVMFV
jgi:hypothetical protein